MLFEAGHESVGKMVGSTTWHGVGLCLDVVAWIFERSSGRDPFVSLHRARRASAELLRLILPPLLAGAFPVMCTDGHVY